MKLVMGNLSSFEFLRSNPRDSIIFTDVDGTLSEIAAAPDKAYVGDKMKQTLNELADGYKVVVVSGRPAGVAKQMVGSDKITYLGNHGLEKLAGNKLSRLNSARYVSAIKRLKPELEQAVAKFEGVRFEDKGQALAIHYRLADNQPEIRRRILEIAEPATRQHGFNIIEGRKVIEIKPGLSDKGRAVADMITESRRKQVVYLGDDRTDVDAFRKLKELRAGNVIRGYALGVASEETPAEIRAEADFCFTSINEVESFLEWLAEKRKT